MIAAVVVTHNRKDLLKHCLEAIRLQTKPLDFVFVVDNHSTDGTFEFISRNGLLEDPLYNYIFLSENIGGAGGFCEGLKTAINSGAEWVWMMDDDAVPHPTALDELLRVATDRNNIYGSLAVDGDDTSWVTSLVDPPVGDVCESSFVPEVALVRSLPFLGFFIHVDLVSRIGFPDPGFFIAADDVEYCLRGEKAGAKIIVAGRSRISHPKSRPYKVSIMGKPITCIALPPWKRYYDTRNRVLISRKYFGLRLFTQTIPGSFVRMFATLIFEPRKVAQLWAWVCGMLDGLLGLKGKRHDVWRISV